VRRHPRVAEALAEAQGFAGGTQAGIQQTNTAKKETSRRIERFKV